MLKIFPKTGGALTSNVIRAVGGAIAHKLDVVSCSFRGETPSKLEEETYARARRANVLVIAAVGNHASWVRYPAAYPRWSAWERWIARTASRRFRTPGAEVDFVAPGVDLLSTIVSGSGRVGSITLDDGTSLTARPFAYSRMGETAGMPVDCLQGNSADFPPPPCRTSPSFFATDRRFR